MKKSLWIVFLVAVCGAGFGCAEQANFRKGELLTVYFRADAVRGESPVAMAAGFLDLQATPLTARFERGDREYLVLVPMSPEKTAIREIVIPKGVILAITRSRG